MDENIQKAMQLLESSMSEPDQRFPMSFEKFVAAVSQNPAAVIRNVFQIFRDMVSFYVVEMEDEYPDDPEVLRYYGIASAAATRQARFQLDAALDVLEARRRSVTTQVRNAYRGVLASISLVQALEAAEVSSKSALEATEAGFDVGTRTLVDVLDSQRDLLRVQRDLDDSRYQYILNNLSLLQAAGTLDSSNVQNANKLLQ